MSAPRITMRQLKDVLRLRLQANLSYRQIAVALKLSYGVVAKYATAAAAAGLAWAEAEALDETTLARRLVLATASPSPRMRRVPDGSAIHQELKKKGVTLKLLWEEYTQAANGNGCYGYAQFCVHYRAYRDSLKRSLRQTHRAGEKCFVDYAGPTVPIVDGSTGECRSAQIFVAVLGASNYTYAEATWTQTLPDWIGSHNRALAFFGGVPAIIVPDNLKSAIIHACRYEPEANPTYTEWAAHYGCVVIPARPYKPKDKSKVEVAVQIVRALDSGAAASAHLL